mmetsp:Transcript_98461/g.301209  ORF Transcript_98461/g.301209 Transcript_98461/m.301209 type:complete len:232 (+) Transcript_98461:616-1311(+)
MPLDPLLLVRQRQLVVARERDPLHLVRRAHLGLHDHGRAVPDVRDEEPAVLAVVQDERGGRARLLHGQVRLRIQALLDLLETSLHFPDLCVCVGRLARLHRLDHAPREDLLHVVGNQVALLTVPIEDSVRRHPLRHAVHAPRVLVRRRPAARLPTLPARVADALLGGGQRVAAEHPLLRVRSPSHVHVRAECHLRRHGLFLRATLILVGAARGDSFLGVDSVRQRRRNRCA